MRKYRQPILLALALVLSYFPLSFFIFATKWDNLSAYFPYKRISSMWWNSGKIPFWNPYQNLGYPIHGDPQSYVWYPISNLLGAINGYTLYSLNIDTVLHIVIGAVGILKLFEYFSISRKAAWIAALLFGLSGFVSGSSNMVGFTLGAAWFPWCFLYLNKLLNHPNYKNAIISALFTWLHVTGAYPAFTIILAYIMVGFYGYKLTTTPKNNRKLFPQLGYILLFGAITVLLCLPYLVSVADSWHYVTRSVPLAYSTEHYMGNLNWYGLLTYLVPYGIMSKDGFMGSYLSLTSVYIGIIPFIMGAWYIVTRAKNNKLLILLYVVSILLALGYYTAVHRGAYEILPGFKMFRHPYIFTLYSTIILLFLFAKSWDTLTKKVSSQLLNKIWIGLTAIFGSFIVIELIVDFPSTASWLEFKDFIVGIKEFSTFNTNQQSAVQLFLLCLYTGIFLFVNYKKWFKPQKLLALYIVGESLLLLTIMSPSNVYYNVPFSKIDAHLEKLDNSGLTNQAANTPLDSLQNSTIEVQAGLWVNLNTFTKTTGINGYNPYRMSEFYTLLKSEQYSDITRKGIAYTTSGARVKSFKIGFNEFSMTVRANKLDTLHLSQMYHHRWMCTVNDRQIPILKSNYGTMQVSLETGNNKIVITYQNEYVKTALKIQIGVLLMLFLFLLYHYFSRSSTRLLLVENP
jgi:hypothetical protein